MSGRPKKIRVKIKLPKRLAAIPGVVDAITQAITDEINNQVALAKPAEFMEGQDVSFMRADATAKARWDAESAPENGEPGTVMVDGIAMTPGERVLIKPSPLSSFVTFDFREMVADPAPVQSEPDHVALMSRIEKIDHYGRLIEINEKRLDETLTKLKRHNGVGQAELYDDRDQYMTRLADFRAKQAAQIALGEEKSELDPDTAPAKLSPDEHARAQTRAEIKAVEDSEPDLHAGIVNHLKQSLATFERAHTSALYKLKNYSHDKVSIPVWEEQRDHYKERIDECIVGIANLTKSASDLQDDEIAELVPEALSTLKAKLAECERKHSHALYRLENCSKIAPKDVPEWEMERDRYAKKIKDYKGTIVRMEKIAADAAFEAFFKDSVEFIQGGPAPAELTNASATNAGPKQTEETAKIAHFRHLIETNEQRRLTIVHRLATDPSKGSWREQWIRDRDYHDRQIDECKAILAELLKGGATAAAQTVLSGAKVSAGKTMTKEDISRYKELATAREQRLEPVEPSQLDLEAENRALNRRVVALLGEIEAMTRKLNEAGDQSPEIERLTRERDAWTVEKEAWKKRAFAAEDLAKDRLEANILLSADAQDLRTRVLAAERLHRAAEAELTNCQQREAKKMKRAIRALRSNGPPPRLQEEPPAGTRMTM